MDQFYAERIDGKFTGLLESDIPASDRKGEKANIVGEPFELSQAALRAVGIIRNPSTMPEQASASTAGRHVAQPGEIEPKSALPNPSGSGRHVKE